MRSRFSRLVRLIALATGPIMDKVEEAISMLDYVIAESKEEPDVST